MEEALLEQILPRLSGGICSVGVEEFCHEQEGGGDVGGV